MMTDIKINTAQAGPLQLRNIPADAPTIYIDGFGTVTADAVMAKVGFYEQLAGANGEVVGRYVVNLALSMSNLKQLSETLIKVLEQAEAVTNARS